MSGAPVTSAPVPEDRRTEQEKEEQRERYQELLGELRTILPGVQVLFAFLLTVPFASRFEQVDDLGKKVFAFAILGAACSTVMFLTPAAFHRMAPKRDRADRLRVGVALVVLGMALLAASTAAAVFVVVRFVFDSTPLGLVFAGVVTVAVGVLWYALPFVARD